MHACMHGATIHIRCDTRTYAHVQKIYVHARIHAAYIRCTHALFSIIYTRISRYVHICRSTIIYAISRYMSTYIYTYALVQTFKLYAYYSRLYYFAI